MRSYWHYAYRQPPSFRGGQEEHKSKRPDTPLIAVSILPHQYAVEKIAGTHARTVTLVGPGQSPHSYEPTPRQMSALSQADAWILSHTDFEVALVPKISGTRNRMTHMTGRMRNTPKASRSTLIAIHGSAGNP